MKSRAATYRAQALTAAVASARIGAASTGAAAAEAVAEVTGGGGDTLAELRTEITTLQNRVDALEP